MNEIDRNLMSCHATLFAGKSIIRDYLMMLIEN
jgi:hypothetical protein